MGTGVAARRHLRARRGGRTRRAAHPSGHLLALGLVSTSVALAFSGAGGLMLLGYPIAAVVVSAWLLLRRHDGAYIEFALWLWLVTPGVRRVVDYTLMRHALSPILVAPSLVSCAALVRVVLSRLVISAPVARAFGVAVLVFSYGAVVGVARNGLRPAAAAALQLFAPLIFGLFVASSRVNDDELTARLALLARRAIILLSVYGIVQFLVLPPWDAAWMIESDISSVGRPVPGEIRVFSLLNTAGPFAQVLGSLLVIELGLVRRRPLWQVTGIAMGYVALGLSLVRAAWFGFAGGVAVLARHGRVSGLRVILVGAVGGVLIGLWGGSVGEAVFARAAATVEAGAEDRSLQQRLAFQREIAPLAVGNVLGEGLGSAGLASTLNETAATRYRHFDSGIFSNLFALGPVAAGALFLAVLSAWMSAASRAVGSSVPESTWVAAACVPLFGFVFTNSFYGVYGVILWTLFAMSGRSMGADRGDRGRPSERRRPVHHL